MTTGGDPSRLAGLPAGPEIRGLAAMQARVARLAAWDPGPLEPHFAADAAAAPPRPEGGPLEPRPGEAGRPPGRLLDLPAPP
jgi:hypothetical protein